MEFFCEREERERGHFRQFCGGEGEGEGLPKETSGKREKGKKKRGKIALGM